MIMILDRIHTGSSGSHRRTSDPVLLLVAAAAAIDRGALKLLLWLERAQQRQQLLGLSDDALKDFGASRCDAASEGTKPFWR